jgi:YfiH family protein
MSVLPFAFAEKIPGLRAFTSLRGLNLGLNTAEPKPEVLRQREELWKSVQLPLASAIFMNQAHGDRLEIVGRAQAGRGSGSLDDAMDGCDAMISLDKGVFLCVGHADCLAILLVDARQGLVGAAHSGWRGAALGISTKLARTMMQQCGSRPGDLHAGLSVCLGPCHLELSEEQHRIFSSQEGHENFCSPLKAGHFHLNLWEQARGQLLRLGVPEAQIEIQKDCTACHPERFYSYRRELGNCGRMMSVVGFQ